MLKEKINDEIKSAMKNGDKIRLETLRSIRASIIEFEKSGINRELNTEDELKIINSQVKKRKDSIDIFEKGNRTDLADKEKLELNILMEFLPEQLSGEKLQHTIESIIIGLGEINESDFGKIMGVVMKELKGKADGKVIQEIVKNKLKNA